MFRYIYNFPHFNGYICAQIYHKPYLFIYISIIYISLIYTYSLNPAEQFFLLPAARNKKKKNNFVYFISLFYTHKTNTMGLFSVRHYSIPTKQFIHVLVAPKSSHQRKSTMSQNEAEINKIGAKI